MSLEGLIALCASGNKVSMIEVNSETGNVPPYHSEYIIIIPSLNK